MKYKYICSRLQFLLGYNKKHQSIILSMTKAYQFSISVHYQEKQLLSKAVRLKFLLLLKRLSCPGRKSLGFKPLPKQPIKGTP